MLTAALLVVAGVVLGLAGGAIWAAAAPRAVYQVASLRPPTAYATNPETNAFIATDGIYSLIALAGGAVLGLAGYLSGVRRYGPVPMAGIVAGAISAAFLARWLGPVLTGQGTFNVQLGSSRPGELLRAPISLGAGGALAFWPVAAAFVAGGLELSSVLRARQLSQDGGQGHAGAGLPSGRPAARGRRGRRRAAEAAAARPAAADGSARPASADGAVAADGPAPSLQPWFPVDPAPGAPAQPVSRELPPEAGA